MFQSVFISILDWCKGLKCQKCNLDISKCAYFSIWTWQNEVYLLHWNGTIASFS